MIIVLQVNAIHGVARQTLTTSAIHTAGTTMVRVGQAPTTQMLVGFVTIVRGTDEGTQRTGKGFERRPTDGGTFDR